MRSIFVTLVAILASMSLFAQAESLPSEYIMLSPARNTSLFEVKECAVSSLTQSSCDVIGTLTVQQTKKLANDVYWRAIKREAVTYTVGLGVVVGAAAGGAYAGILLCGGAAAEATATAVGAVGASSLSFNQIAAVFGAGLAGAMFGGTGGGILGTTAGVAVVAGTDAIFSFTRTTSDLWTIQGEIQTAIDKGNPMVLKSNDRAYGLLLSLLDQAGMKWSPATGSLSEVAPLN